MTGREDEAATNVDLLGDYYCDTGVGDRGGGVGAWGRGPDRGIVAAVILSIVSD